MKNKPILVVAGEPKSIFIEIFLKSLKFKEYKHPIILICNKDIFLEQCKLLDQKINVNIINLKSFNNFKNKIVNKKKINLINIDIKKPINKANNERYIKNSFKIAFDLIKREESYKMINGPINKKAFLNKKFLGMTEYIAHNFKIKNFGMLIFNKKLSVSIVTTHLPIKLVSKSIKKKTIIEKIKLINDFYQKNFQKKPKIGVASLNPHCESILKFNEDLMIVSKAVKIAKSQNFFVDGPNSADTIFLKANRFRYDVILGMYHDQVLAPFKTLYEYDAINITMGLPFLRISPDHGTNEKMFGKNESNPLSLIRAFEFLDNR